MRLQLLAVRIAAVVGVTLPQRELAFQLRTHRKNINFHTGSKSKLLDGFAPQDAASLLASTSRPDIGWLEKTNHKKSLSPTSWSSIDPLKLLRGGGALPLLKSIPMPSTKAILIASKLWAGSMLLMGTLPLVAPVTYAKSARKGILFQDVEEDSFDSSLIQSIGAIVIGFAIHVQLALSNTLASDSASAVSLSHAMGYALLPRILLILWSFVRARLQKSKGEYQFEGTNFLKINFFLMTWTAFSLLTNAGNPAVSAKVFSTMALIKAMALVLKPVKMTEKIFGVNVSGGEEMSQSCVLARVLGNCLAVHAILMLCLACGVNPSAAVGISAFVWTVLPFWILRMN